MWCKGLHRAFFLLLTGLLFFSSFPFPADAATVKPTRVISFVYDDSGSMIDDDVEGYNDRWCQAKYALEVFAAMLDETDTMQVYAMSDFADLSQNYRRIPPHLTLSGSDPAKKNIASIHDMLTEASGTPFTTVRKACDDLRQSTAAEKWLVVLTDGVFSDERNQSMQISEVEQYFAHKDDAISVLYLGIGSGALNISQHEEQNIYSYSAANSTDILGSLTEMSNRIFERNRLQVDTGSGSFSFDIPMSELIVFAQGKAIHCNGIYAADGTLIAPDTAPVAVQYADVAAKNYLNDPKVQINDNLEGKIAYFSGDFDAGTYTVDVPGASTIEIYYRPNVDVTVQLINAEGTMLSASDPIPEGTYTLSYGFVKPGTEELLPESALLGDIDFSATVTLNDVVSERTYTNGDHITVPEGTMEIAATARYLDYNTVETDLHYDVFLDKPLVFSIADHHTYRMCVDGFDDPTVPLLLSVALEDRPLTKQEWEQLSIPRLSFLCEEERLGDLSIEKTEDVGVFAISPSVYQDAPKKNAIGDFPFHVSLQQKKGIEVWSGQTDGVLHIADGMSILERYPWLLPTVLSILLVLLIITWWMTRKVFPKYIKIQKKSTRFRVGPLLQEGIEAKCAFKRKRKRLEISSPPCTQNYAAQCTVALLLKAVDRRYVRSEKRRVCIVEIRTIGNVYSINIDGTSYAKNKDGKWIAEMYAGSGSDRTIAQCIRNANIEMKTGSKTRTVSRCTCDLKHI